MKNVVTRQLSTSAFALTAVLLFSPSISFADSSEAAEDQSNKSSVECPEEDVAMMGMGMGMMGMGTGTQGTQGTMGGGGMGMGMMGMGMGMMHDGETPEDEIAPEGAVTHSPCSKNNTDDNTQ